MDALTQLLESYLSTAANPLTDSLALSGIEAIGKSLIHLCCERSEDISEEKELRSQMAYAAYLSGITLANAGLSTVHGFASSVGGRFDIPHCILCGTLLAETLDISLDYLIEHQMTDFIKKYAIAGNILLTAMKSEFKSINDVNMDAKALIITLRDMIGKLQLPLLSEYNVRSEDLRSLAEETSNKNNPALLSETQ